MIWWLLTAFVAAGLFLVWIAPAVRLLNSLQSRKTVGIPVETATRAGCRILIFSSPKLTGATLVMIPGLHPDGIRDPRFQAFAAACSFAGFQVVAIDVEEYRHLRITGESLRQIREVIRELPDLVRPESLRNLGLLGISFGTGSVFACAAEESLRDRIHFVVSIGGFCSLIPALRFAVTGARAPEMKRRPVQPWGRLILAYQHLEQLSPPHEATLLRQILELHFKMCDTEASLLAQQLSPETRSLLAELIQGSPATGNSRLEALLPDYEGVSRHVSPAFLADRLSPQLRVFLVHGRSDDLLPFEETEELNRLLRSRMCVRTLITGSLTHVDPVHPWRGWWSWLRLVIWTRVLLREASLHS